MSRFLGNLSRLGRSLVRRLVPLAQPTDTKFRRIFERSLDAVVMTTTFDGRYLERKHAEEALRENERKYRSLVETSGDLIWSLDANGRIAFVNGAAEAIFGYRPDEMVGRTFDDFLAPGAACEGEHGGFHHGEPSVGHESEYLRRGGERVLLSTNSTPLVDAAGRIVGVTGISRDITAKRRAEQVLRESEARFRELSESIDVVFWIVSAVDGMPLYVSPAFEAIWGRPRPETIDSFYDGLHPDDLERVRTALARWLQTRSELEVEFRVVRLDGAVRWIRAHGFPLRDADGGIDRLGGVAEDVTERKQLEERLHQSQRMEALGRLAGGLAHDFNNLLTVIQGSANLAMREIPAGSTPHQDLAAIDEASRRAGELTRRLLALARRQMGYPQVIDLDEMFAEMQRMLQSLIGEDVELVASLDPDLARVKMDPSQLDQLLVNLVVNARDAMPGGGKIFIEIGNAPLADAEGAARGLPAGDYVRLAVRDTGCGIPAEAKPHIFEPFFTSRRSGKETGLGLATCYGIVTQGGGRIEVESEVGRGASFIVYLPALQGSASAPVASADVRATAAGNERILLVEDERLVRDLAARTLRDQGYDVAVAGSAEEALTSAAADASASLDLLLTDVVMPGIWGTELANRLLTRLPKLKVLLMSGYVDDVWVHYDMVDQRVPFLQKPFAPETLARKVREVLDQARATSA